MNWAAVNPNGTIDVLYLYAPDDTTGLSEVPDKVLADWRLVDGEWIAPSSQLEPIPTPIPTAEQIRAALKAAGKSDAQIDALFALAAAI